jgi:hypothetical protein
MEHLPENETENQRKIYIAININNNNTIALFECLPRAISLQQASIEFIQN